MQAVSPMAGPGQGIQAMPTPRPVSGRLTGAGHAAAAAAPWNPCPTGAAFFGGAPGPVPSQAPVRPLGLMPGAVRPAMTVPSLGLAGSTRLLVEAQLETAIRLERMAYRTPEPRWMLLAVAETLRGRHEDLAGALEARASALTALATIVRPLARLADYMLSVGMRSRQEVVNDVITTFDRAQEQVGSMSVGTLLRELSQGHTRALTDEIEQLSDLAEGLQDAIPLFPDFFGFSASGRTEATDLAQGRPAAKRTGRDPCGLFDGGGRPDGCRPCGDARDSRTSTPSPTSGGVSRWSWQLVVGGGGSESGGGVRSYEQLDRGKQIYLRVRVLGSPQWLPQLLFLESRNLGRVHEVVPQGHGRQQILFLAAAGSWRALVPQRPWSDIPCGSATGAVAGARRPSTAGERKRWRGRPGRRRRGVSW